MPRAFRAGGADGDLHDLRGRIRGFPCRAAGDGATWAQLASFLLFMITRRRSSSRIAVPQCFATGCDNPAPNPDRFTKPSCYGGCMRTMPRSGGHRRAGRGSCSSNLARAEFPLTVRRDAEPATGTPSRSRATGTRRWRPGPTDCTPCFRSFPQPRVLTRALEGVDHGAPRIRGHHRRNGAGKSTLLGSRRACRLRRTHGRQGTVGALLELGGGFHRITRAARTSTSPAR
jgi:hypothetical protein